MRLNKYINEIYQRDKKIEPIYKLIDKNCAPFLKEIKNVRMFLYRGSEENIDRIKRIKPRKDRRPKDMPEELHETFDDLFHKKFGWYVRSEGVFVTGDKVLSASYGTPYLFFPIGKYKYVWSSKIMDLYTEIENEEYFGDAESWYSEWESEYEDSNKGTYYYHGENLETNDYNDAVEIALENAGLGELGYGDELDWVPDIPMEEYLLDKENEYINDKNKYLKSLVREYEDRNLKVSRGTKNEIAFKCKSYYLVNPVYVSALYDKLFE